MTELKQIYKCSICGNIIEVLHPAPGQLVCCNQTMELLIEKTEDSGQEKHVPIIEKTETGIKVKIGSIPHPMEESHLIEWIELTVENKIHRKFLKVGGKPEAEFNIKVDNIKTVQAREYCNLHSLWQG